MSNPVVVEFDLKDLLAKMDARLERIEDKMDARLDRIEDKLEALPRIEAEISPMKGDIQDLKSRASTQIWALIVTVIGAVIAAITKFVFFPNP